MRVLDIAKSEILRKEYGTGKGNLVGKQLEPITYLYSKTSKCTLTDENGENMSEGLMVTFTVTGFLALKGSSSEGVVGLPPLSVTCRHPRYRTTLFLKAVELLCPPRTVY